MIEDFEWVPYQNFVSPTQLREHEEKGEKKLILQLYPFVLECVNMLIEVNMFLQ